jgi:hypothetical protein
MNRIQNQRKLETSPLDFYATHPQSVRSFLTEFKQITPLQKLHLWEPAAGTRNICKVLKEQHIDFFASDIHDYSNETEHLINFLESSVIPDEKINGLITNPPYKHATEFVYQFLDLFKDMKGAYGIFYLKLLFLEGINRYSLFQRYSPQYVFLHSSRQGCDPQGNFDFKNGGAVAYAWFVWKIGYKGGTTIKWIPPN